MERKLASIQKIVDIQPIDGAEGSSLNAKSREVVVFKSTNGTKSFKAISNSWLIKNDG